MLEYDNIETWEELRALEVEEIVKYMNSRLDTGATIESIMGTLGAARRSGSKYLRRRGYKFDGKRYVLVSPEQEENKQIIKPNIEKPKDITPDHIQEPSVKLQTAPRARNKRDAALEVYADVHNTLKELDTADYVRTSLSYAKETKSKLDTFLKDKPLLKKQDFITHAIESALQRYSK